jgi:hypothetical protein
VVSDCGMGELEMLASISNINTKKAQVMVYGVVSSRDRDVLTRRTGIGIIFLKWNSSLGDFIDSNRSIDSKFVANSDMA